MQKLLSITIALGVACAVFAVLERRWQALPGRSFWQRRGQLTDVVYWFLNALLAEPMMQAATVVAVVPLALALGAPLRGEGIKAWIEARRTLVTLQPAWIQALEILILSDFIGYWAHRLLHRRPLWRFHVVHHAIKELDWLSANRVHPVNELLMRVASIAPLFLLGFRGDVLAGAASLLPLYSLVQHANVRWSFGPLRYVFASPRFHRWHHTSEAHGLDKNFANLLPVWDLIFGTFYMPKGEEPSSFGVRDELPSSVLGQLAWPFRRA
jgi:sterol desaturase/sphingolipid hydroxylase (fatty acid hydroxylase superfamily)